MIFQNTRLELELPWSSFKPGASLTFIDSTVENGDIGFGRIEKIEAKDSHLDMGGRGMTVNTVDIRGGYTNVGFGGKVNTISVRDTTLNQLDLTETTVTSVRVQGCSIANTSSPGVRIGDLHPNLAGAAGQITISDCGGAAVNFENATAGRLTLRNATPNRLILKGSTIKDLDLAHVTVEGKADISAAHVEAYRRHAVKRGSGASYVHEGANFELFGPDTDNALEESKATRSSPARDQNAQAGSSWLQRWFGGQG